MYRSTGTYFLNLAAPLHEPSRRTIHTKSGGVQVKVSSCRNAVAELETRKQHSTAELRSLLLPNQTLCAQSTPLRELQ